MANQRPQNVESGRSGLWNWILFSGVILVFITAGVDLFVSCQNRKALKTLETYKFSLSFVKEKFDVLRKFRSQLTGDFPSLPEYDDIVADAFSRYKDRIEKEHTIPWDIYYEYIANYRDELYGKHQKNVKIYTSIKYFLSKEVREKLDKLITIIGEQKPYTIEDFRRVLKKAKEEGRPIASSLMVLEFSPVIIFVPETISDMFMISEFQNKLIAAIDAELQTIIDKYSPA